MPSDEIDVRVELLDCGLDCKVEKLILPLLGLPPLRSASFLNKSYSSFGSTGLDKKKESLIRY